MRISALGAKLSEGFSTRCSPPSATPAITIACAFVRDGARPRSTSSLSIRSRFISLTLYRRNHLEAQQCRISGGAQPELTDEHESEGAGCVCDDASGPFVVYR